MKGRALILESYIGQRFGRMTVLGPIDRSTSSPKINCLCDCGIQKFVRLPNLIVGRSVSCGCSRGTKKSSQHKPTYSVWCAIHSRCKAASGKSKKLYADRGIRVCARWRVYANFLEDMGLRPEGTSIDRINNALGYEPGNCRWATPKQQALNRRSNVILEYNGETLHLTQWSEKLGISYSAITNRLKRGWSIEDALTKANQRPRRS